MLLLSRHDTVHLLYHHIQWAILPWPREKLLSDKFVNSSLKLHSLSSQFMSFEFLECGEDACF